MVLTIVRRSSSILRAIWYLRCRASFTIHPIIATNDPRARANCGHHSHPWAFDRICPFSLNVTSSVTVSQLQWQNSETKRTEHFHTCAIFQDFSKIDSIELRLELKPSVSLWMAINSRAQLLNRFSFSCGRRNSFMWIGLSRVLFQMFWLIHKMFHLSLISFAAATTAIRVSLSHRRLFLCQRYFRINNFVS
jgi:hypothetical protein